MTFMNPIKIACRLIIIGSLHKTIAVKFITKIKLEVSKKYFVTSRLVFLLSDFGRIYNEMLEDVS